MNHTPARKRRDRKKATDLRRRGVAPAKPRRGSPKLTRIERNKLRAGCLKRIRPQDTVGILATRLGQSEACVREALSHDIRCVDEVLDGGKCPEIVEMRPEWSAAFVDLARRDIFARRNYHATQRLRGRNSYDTQGGQPPARSEARKPWTAFNRGKSKVRRDRRQTKVQRYRAQVSQLRSVQKIEDKAAFDRLCLDEGAHAFSLDDLASLCMDVEL